MLNKSGKSLVYSKRCFGYAACDEVILEVLVGSGLADKLRNTKVFLKPNLMKGAAPELALNTHPEFVGALTRILVNWGSEVLVGDSSGLLGFTDEVLEASGVASAVLAAGGKVLNLDRGPFRKIASNGLTEKAFWIPEAVLDSRVVLSVPKLKTHTLTGISCSLKNLVGILPGATKCVLHVHRSRPADFCDALWDLYDALTAQGVDLDAAIVDGIWGLSGMGRPEGPRMRELGLVAASSSLASLDLLCATAIGVPSREVETINAAIRRGIGPSRIEQVSQAGDIVRAPWCAFDCAKRGLKERYSLSHAAYYWTRARLVRPVHVPELCEGHSQCVEVCPVNALHRTGSKVQILSHCIGCYACHEVCPTGAMALRVPWLLRSMFRSRTAGMALGKLR
jgi:uncharacterized protein (DUF362 family)/NAD-dependent dihydropyrimidine dehydrogenase PreA subunit